LVVWFAGWDVFQNLGLSSHFPHTISPHFRNLIKWGSWVSPSQVGGNGAEGIRHMTRELDHGFSISQEAWRSIAYAVGLSQRELEVLQCVVADQHEQEIGVTLKLSRHTIRTYLKRIRAKLGTGSRVRLVEIVFAEYSAWVARSVTPS
jgi:DNA-binding CsgD family transcriptional regulator